MCQVRQIETASTLRGAKTVGHLEGPDRRGQRVVLFQSAERAICRPGGFVREAPGQSDRGVDDEHLAPTLVDEFTEGQPVQQVGLAEGPQAADRLMRRPCRLG